MARIGVGNRKVEDGREERQEGDVQTMVAPEPTLRMLIFTPPAGGATSDLSFKKVLWRQASNVVLPPPLSSSSQPLTAKLQ